MDKCFRKVGKTQGRRKFVVSYDNNTSKCQDTGVIPYCSSLLAMLEIAIIYDRDSISTVLSRPMYTGMHGFVYQRLVSEGLVRKIAVLKLSLLDYLFTCGLQHLYQLTCI